MKRFGDSFFCVSELPDGVRRIAETLNRHGLEACIVGGAVRDIVSGRKPSDFDMVTTGTPEEIAEIFPEVKFAGASFGVMLLKTNGAEIELASAREERFYLDGRHPDQVRYTRDLDVDAMRRDFTINAMRLDPLTGKLHDPANGVEDLKHGIIRTVGDPRIRFKEDYLRMLRAVRFAARFGFTIAPETIQAIQENAPLASRLSGERIREELTRILTGKSPGRALELLHTAGLLRAILPEADAMAGVTQPEEFHPEGDVFRHTCLMLEHMAYPDELLAWSVLLHDIGKPLTRSVDPDGRIRFFCHEETGEKMAHNIMERLHFSNAARDAVARAVRNHMRMASVREMRKAKLKRLLADDNFSLELELHRLDCISCHAIMDTFIFLTDELRKEPDNTLPSAWITGKDLIAAGLKPSPAFKTILDKCFDRQLAGSFSSREQALEFVYEEIKYL